MENRIVEIFLFEDTFFFTTRVNIKKVEEDRIILTTTPLLNKLAMLGKKAHMRYSTFALPVKIVGKNEDEIIVSVPSLNPERPVGDRRSARVPPSHVHPVKLKLEVEGKMVDWELEDISEGGFSIVVSNTSEVDMFMDREVKFHMDFPVEVEEIEGTAKLVNIQEFEEGKIKLGFEMLIDDADAVKVRFYIYSRIREIIRS